jgi:sugar lactone lactonase YvrE
MRIRTWPIVMNLCAAACGGDDAEGATTTSDGSGSEGTSESGAASPGSESSDSSSNSSAPADETTSADGSSETGDAQPPAELELPGDAFYPESLTATADGTIYVGSLATGMVVRFAPGAIEAETFIAGAGQPPGATGLLADETAQRLYLCAVDVTQLFGMEPIETELHAYDLRDGTHLATYPFPDAALCNDLALGASGNVYVTDSFGAVFELVPGQDALVPWSEDPLLAPSTAAGFGADGIAFDGIDQVYVNTFSDGGLLRIAVLPDGSAGPAEAIEVQPALLGPDGMRALDADTLVVVDGVTGLLSELTIAGTTASGTTLRRGLNQPTSVFTVGTDHWVTEGQVGVLTGAVKGPPSLPFLVQRVPTR